MYPKIFPSGICIKAVIVSLALSCALFSNAKSQTPEDASIADSVKTFLIPENLQYFLGMGMNIVERGREDFTFTHGWARNDQSFSFTDSTLFNLGSVSKLFTAIAIMKLRQKKLLELDDPVYKYFPEFLRIQGKNRFAAAITIRDLLQHRSGLTQSMEDLFPEHFDKKAFKEEGQYYENTFNYRAFMSLEDFRNRFMMYARLDEKPRKKYHFSNLGYVILGYIAEQVAGVNLGQIVTDEIFAPLGMEESWYYRVPDSLEKNLAYGYYRLSDGSYLNVHENEIESPSPTGDGGIRTSLRDMRKFMRYLVGDPTKDELYDVVLSRSLLLSMTGPMVKGPDRTTWVGLGFHNLQPYNFTGHAGGWDGFLSILYYHPESHSCFFTVTNREDNHLFMFLTVYSAYAMLHRKF